MNSQDVIMEVTGLKKHFPIHKGFFKKEVGRVKAVDGVDFTIYRGETLGLVGESGCGKTTLGRALLRLIEPTAGTVKFYPRDGNEQNITELEPAELKSLRRSIQIIFQDPFSSLDPRMLVQDIVTEPLVINKIGNRQERMERAVVLLEKVGLSPYHMRRYPHEFSGGQRQRIGIARALALEPQLLVCDEPVSALDVSVQAQVLNLLIELQKEFALTYLFIAHDLSVVEFISDRVMVMYLGKIVEIASGSELYQNPKHPYTEALLAAIPSGTPHIERKVLEGTVPSPANPPPGCHFHTRCPYAQDICKIQEPELEFIGEQHRVACHFAHELTLEGYKGFTGKQYELPEWLTQDA